MSVEDIERNFRSQQMQQKIDPAIKPPTPNLLLQQQQQQQQQAQFQQQFQQRPAAPPGLVHPPQQPLLPHQRLPPGFPPMNMLNQNMAGPLPPQMHPNHNMGRPMPPNVPMHPNNFPVCYMKLVFNLHCFSQCPYSFPLT